MVVRGRVCVNCEEEGRGTCRTVYCRMSSLMMAGVVAGDAKGDHLWNAQVNVWCNSTHHHLRNAHDSCSVTVPSCFGRLTVHSSY
jgi:hypothetical protein